MASSLLPWKQGHRKKARRAAFQSNVSDAWIEAVLGGGRLRFGLGQSRKKIASHSVPAANRYGAEADLANVSISGNSDVLNWIACYLCPATGKVGEYRDIASSLQNEAKIFRHLPRDQFWEQRAAVLRRKPKHDWMIVNIDSESRKEYCGMQSGH